MTEFTTHSQGTASVESQSMRENLRKAICFVTALYGVLARTPVDSAFEQFTWVKSAPNVLAQPQSHSITTANGDFTCQLK